MFPYPILSLSQRGAHCHSLSNCDIALGVAVLNVRRYTNSDPLILKRRKQMLLQHFFLNARLHNSMNPDLLQIQLAGQVQLQLAAKSRPATALPASTIWRKVTIVPCQPAITSPRLWH